MRTCLEKRKRPRLRLESWDARSEQPSPENCSQPPYFLICVVRMAPTCHWALEAPHSYLQEQTILNLSEFHGCGAGFVVVRHVIDPPAFQPNSTTTATSNFDSYFSTSFASYFSRNFRSEEHTSELQSRQYLVC